jgi:hypothetical protein
MNMNSTEKALWNESIIKRLREMRMSPSDIANAEAAFRKADAIVDLGFGVVAALRSSAAYVTRHLRAAFVSTPQH